MSDLDKAIRADLAQRARETAPEAADRSMVAYADAIRSVLDLHAHTEVPGLPMRQCAACGLVSRGRWCDTVSAIADDLGVSGEDRFGPTPAPCSAKGVNHDTRAIVDCELHEGHEGTHQQGDKFWRAGAPEHVLAALRSEVVTPEGTS